MCSAIFPEWLTPQFEASFGADAADEGQALGERAPVDLRANLLKTTRDKALAALAHLSPQPTPFSPVGLRIAIRPDGRGPALNAEPAYLKGLVEVQDEGSQLAALLAEAKPGMQVLDLCAGAGGKTLAMAAAMENQGQIYATDADGRRLAPIFDRLTRSGARNVQVRVPRGGRTSSPTSKDVAIGCSSTRPAPDRAPGGATPTPNGASARARWSSASRIRTKRLKSAMRFVKRGGRIVYATCSLFRAENEDRVAAFLARHDDMLPVDAGAQANAAGLAALAGHRSPFGPGFRLSPRTTGTDGFYIATLTRV